MIQANLRLFAVIIVTIIVGVWLVLAFSYSSLLASKNGQIELLDRQLADYREKLKGATPAEAKAKIDALEEKVQNTIGNKWQPLTTGQSTKLTSLVKSLPKRRIQVMYSNYLGKDLAQNIAGAFTQAGWTDMHFGEGGGLGYGLSTGRGVGMALTLKQVLEEVTNYKVSIHGETEAEIPEFVFVAVGIKND